MSPEVDAVLARLLPYPEDGSRADGPVAVDATDRLLLDEAAALIRERPDDVVVVGDRFGALTLGAIASGARHVRTQTDAVTAEAALTANSRRASRLLRDAHVAASAPGSPDAAGPGYTQHDRLEPRLFEGARVVLLQLPTSLAELTEIAEHVARYADPAVTLFAGGRVKHMTHAMNDVLAASFAQVGASLARQKSRLLIAREPRSDVGPLTYPVTARLTDREILDAIAPRGARAVAPGAPTADAPAGTAPDGLTVVAHGAAFAGATLDQGTRFLLAQAPRWPDLSDVQVPPVTCTSDTSEAPATPDRPVPGMDAHPVVVDLGCGTGILAAVLGLRYPHAHVLASDRSRAACDSAAATLAANGVRPAGVVRDDAGALLPIPDGSADLVLLNPPFHDRAALSTDAAHRMFATAGRVLRDGGELWTVFNTALHYRRALERAVGPTEHVAQNPRFTVTRSVRKLLTDMSVTGG
ncbi:methyltransferase [Promicromonospora sukumoe]|uniref:16S rRNA (Guanine1207-N2)-methyltransferase n=1 Tax=Promicromonospora sukumoe TaxID=88382 RepID=A0A7W3JC28_9MICO|nr:methyltransferase [Promicromonospora sukumoe]MBA8810092.1 16S rRNA (guanine1207-N2)-methyltransferase [Promicromonospora sukumoe]